MKKDITQMVSDDHIFGAKYALEVILERLNNAKENGLSHTMAGYEAHEHTELIDMIKLEASEMGIQLDD